MTITTLPLFSLYLPPFLFVYLSMQTYLYLPTCQPFHPMIYLLTFLPSDQPSYLLIYPYHFVQSSFFIPSKISSPPDPPDPGRHCLAPSHTLLALIHLALLALLTLPSLPFPSPGPRGKRTIGAYFCLVNFLILFSSSFFFLSF